MVTGSISLRSADAAALREEDRRDWQRHPVDVVRLVMRVGLLVLILAVTAVLPAALTDVSADLVRLFARLPSPLRYALIGIAQATIVIVPLVVIGWLLVRRARLAVLIVVGSAVLGGLIMLLLTGWLDRAAPPTVITDLPSASFVSTRFPSAAYLAAFVAATTTASPMMATLWRRVAWIAVGAAVVVRLLSATQAPVSVAVTLALGGAVGSAVLVAFGSPRRRPGAQSLREALAAGGFAVDDLRDESSSTGRRSYHGTSAGQPIDVIYLDRDDRDVELLSRVVRTIRVRGVDEQTLSTKPRERVAHHAAATLMARRSGAVVPAVEAIVPADRESAVIALDSPSGRSLIELDAVDITDAGLDDLWHQIGRLHNGRVAHRSLTLENLTIDGDAAMLAGLENASLAAGPDARAVDRVELLVSTAAVVGVDRALDSALRVADHAQLVAALPYVQSSALPNETRKLARSHKGLVDDLRVGLQDRLGVEEVELAELDRVSIAKVVTWIGFAVLAFFVLTLVSSWSEITDAMSGIDWVWVVPIFVATLLGTVAGAMSLSGSVVRPIALGEATVVMFGQSFLNRFTPMNAGGMAMRIRYLQKGGTDGTVATAAIGLTSAASGVMQVLFIAFFFLWSSTDPAGDSSGGGGGLDVSVVLVFVVAAAVAVLVVALTPKLRERVVGFARSTVTKVRHDFGELARRPTKLALLFGGAGLGKLLTIIAWVTACRAFGVDLSFAELGALYLVANTVASTVPTPGGVGAIEAALVFVLTNAGVDDATAWASMLLFRLVNYWFPTIPGLVALKICERRELV